MAFKRFVIALVLVLGIGAVNAQVIPVVPSVDTGAQAFEKLNNSTIWLAGRYTVVTSVPVAGCGVSTVGYQQFHGTAATPNAGLWVCENYATGLYRWALVAGSGGGGGTGCIPTGVDGYVLIKSGSGCSSLATNTSGAGTSVAEIATMAGVEEKVNAKTVAVTPGVDNNKTMVVDSTGAAITKLISRLDAFVFDSGTAGVAITQSCSADKLVGQTTSVRFHLLSISRDFPPTDITGSVTVNVYTSPAASPTRTLIGTASLVSAARSQTALAATIAEGSWVEVCVIGTPTTIEKLIVAPEVF